MSNNPKEQRDPNTDNVTREEPRPNPDRSTPDRNEKLGQPNREVPKIGDKPEDRPDVTSNVIPRDPNSPNEKHGHSDEVKPNDGEHAIKRSHEQDDSNQNNNSNE